MEIKRVEAYQVNNNHGQSPLLFATEDEAVKYLNDLEINKKQLESNKLFKEVDNVIETFSDVRDSIYLSELDISDSGVRSFIGDMWRLCQKYEELWELD